MNKKSFKSIGTVIPVGDGATGKSLLVKQLFNKSVNIEANNAMAQEIKKSLNVEIEFDTRKIISDNEIVDTTIQYYTFPGQKNKVRKNAPTFDEIVDIFEFLPALKSVSVLMLIYDTTRHESLKSLEQWLIAAFTRSWITEHTKIVLVCTKVDIQRPNIKFVEQVRAGIVTMLQNHQLYIQESQVTIHEVSSITLEGIEELRKEVFNWIALFGLKKEVI